MTTSRQLIFPNAFNSDQIPSHWWGLRPSQNVQMTSLWGCRADLSGLGVPPDVFFSKFKSKFGVLQTHPELAVDVATWIEMIAKPQIRSQVRQGVYQGSIDAAPFYARFQRPSNEPYLYCCCWKSADWTFLNSWEVRQFLKSFLPPEFIFQVRRHSRDASQFIVTALDASAHPEWQPLIQTALLNSNACIQTDPLQ